MYKKESDVSFLKTHVLNYCSTYEIFCSLLKVIRMVQLDSRLFHLLCVKSYLKSVAKRVQF